MDWKGIYGFAAFITGAIIFIGCWIYCIATYGFLLGVGLGWLPSAICAVVGGCLWPLIAIGIVIGIVIGLGQLPSATRVVLFRAIAPGIVIGIVGWLAGVWQVKDPPES